MATGRDGDGRGGNVRANGPRTGPATVPAAPPAPPRPDPTVRTGPPSAGNSPRRDAPRPAPPRPLASGDGRERPRPPSLVWRPLRWAGAALLAILPLVLFGVGLVYVKLQHGSIPLRFVVGPIQRALDAELGGIRVAMADAELARSQADGTLELRLLGVEVRGLDGEVMARAAEAVVGLDMTALWSRQIAAERIVLIEPRLTLLARDGSIALRPGEPGPRPVAATSAVATAAPGPPMQGAAPASPASPSAPASPSELPLQRSDLARALAELMAHVRRSGDAAVHLSSIGARRATLVIDDNGRKSTWSVPELEIGLEHRQKRSVVVGRAQVRAGEIGTAPAAPGESPDPFVLTFRLEDSEKSKSLRAETRISQLVPRTLAASLPGLPLLDAIDIPVAIAGVFDLTTAGDVIGGRIDVELGEGRLLVPTLAGLPLGFDRGRLALVYRGDTRRLELAPSVLELDGSRVKLGGLLQPLDGGGGRQGWQLDLAALEGHLVNDRRSPPLPIERLTLTSRHWPSTGATELVALSFKAGGAELEVSGALPGSEQTSGASLEGRLGPMSAETLKGVWPSALAPGVRAIVARGLLRGQLKGGTFRVATPPAGSAAAGGRDGRFSLALEGHDLAIEPGPGLPPLTVPRALLRVEGAALEITVPEAAIAAQDGRRIGFKAGSVTIADMHAAPPLIEIAGRAQAPLGAVLDLAARDSVGLVKPGLLPPGIEGKVESQWRASLPVAERIAAADVRVEAKVRITDGRIPDVLGRHDVTGAAFTIAVTEKALDVKGDMLLAGVPAKATGQWIVGEDKARQPLTITTRLDGADRRQLGLDLDAFVQGEVPIEVLLWPGQGERGKVQVNADLTGAELMLDGLAWRKPSGRAARLGFDVVRPKSGKGVELQGFRLSGDSLAIDGTVTLGPDNKPQSYNFPGFSLNVVSNLEVQGQRRSDQSWDVRATGKTFDGSELMRSLYALGEKPDRRGPKPTGVLDLVATVDTVLGLNDGALKQVRLHLRTQDGQAVAMNLRGVLDGGSPLEASLAPMPGQPRIVNVRTPDAGAALKLIGFYSNMLGGQGELRVNLDGRGAAERTGDVTVKRFRVLGDTIVSDVIHGADESRPAIAQGSPRRERRPVREQIEFETLKAVFASGNGQLALESLAAAGPLMGASVRGKIDFRSRRLSLGGTYVPLSGLNRALAGVPVLGELLTGPRGEGVFGVNFAIDGSMDQPQAIVNPLSIVAPGVLRDIFQMGPEAPRVIPGAEAPRAAPAAGGAARVRASPPAAREPATSAPAVAPKVLDGWSSETSRPRKAQP